MMGRIQAEPRYPYQPWKPDNLGYTKNGFNVRSDFSSQQKNPIASIKLC
jgi:hypothetical protein